MAEKAALLPLLADILLAVILPLLAVILPLVPVATKNGTP